MDNANAWTWAVVYASMAGMITAFVNLIFSFIPWSNLGTSFLILVGGIRFIVLPTLFRLFQRTDRIST